MLLDSTETIIFRTNLAWTILIPPIALTAVGLSCSACTGLMYFAEPQPGQPPPPPRELLDAAGNCSACILGLALLLLLAAIINHSVSEVILTNRRLIKKTLGRSMEIFLDKVDSLAIEGSTVVVFSVGGSAQRFKNVKDAEVLRYQILQQIEKRAGYRR